ncbi:ferrochelatase [Acidocella sp.]|uniref:ferrochelatase n=1 Tax=Acidocella sp. TaxID=50710 RepID=UPI00184ED7EC|nr:ferrochelatase [Acidocella sp.]NNM57402.1 ferrochelatase [Acidocella sp.]
MKTAIVLFNLGGPDSPAAIKKFRVNLFSDKAIIRAPIFIRFWLARLIARSSAKAAEKNYALMGGKSPLLATTQAQAAALESAMGGDTKTFIAMRYWHPFALEAARAVKAYNPDRILLLPLYPQFSTTTTGSSLNNWHEAAAQAGLIKPTTTLCCYFDDPAYAGAIAALVDAASAQAKASLPPGARLRLLFSAHGLPESIIARGDPYQSQIEASVTSVMARLKDRQVEHLVCYQSRATPQKWISPSTIEAIEQAGADKTAVLVIPIAFVSDHIETLVELDIENRELAAHCGVPGYFRAPVPNSDPAFIAALAGLARRALAHGNGLCSHQGGRACAATHKNCPWTKYAA